ncbi:MAG: GTP-binding protein [Desulfobacteraceae bacterium]|nr:GTP-binding protein [Desulfobacteraceae bacterium]
MKLNQLYPTDIVSSPEQGLQELLRGFLVRTNFVPGVRHVIGWRGLKETFTNVEGWTAKIKGFAGVFGMYFDACAPLGDWLNATFALLYFPDPQEELVEHCSLQAGVTTQQEDYLLHVRDFLRHPRLCALFSIGIIRLGLNTADNALLLGLESIAHQRVIARDGVSISQEGRTVTVIQPGGYDQNFPSYETALAFFHVLAASFSFNLAEPPTCLKYTRRPGQETVYDAAGRHWEIPSSECHEESLSLGFGGSFMKPIMEKTRNTVVSSDREVMWEAGERIPEEYQDALWWQAHQISNYKTIDKKILGIDDRPQLIILTGYLGAGKTSFLQHFIEYQNQNNRFVAVIQNEIGAVGLDGKLLDHDAAVTEIDEGCVCCTMVGNVKKALHQILSKFHPDHIVLETTGLANPLNLLEELSEVEDLVKFDSVTTVVDGVNIGRILAESDIGRDQIKAADIILLNKNDLLTESQHAAVEAAIRSINPTAPLLATHHGDINPALLYGGDPTDMPDIKNRAAVDPEHHTHLHEGMDTHKIAFPDPVSRDDLTVALDALADRVFRIKGVLDFKDDATPRLVQYVAGRYEFSAFNNRVMTERFLVFIGQHLDKVALEARFKTLTLSVQSHWEPYEAPRRHLVPTGPGSAAAR